LKNRGNHLIIDCINVPENVCLEDKKFLEVMAWAAEKAGMNVINTCRYKFGHDSPAGFTCFCQLDSSHVSAHTYSDDGMCAIDIFTCGPTRPENVLKHMLEQLDLGDISVRKIERFFVEENLETDDDDDD